ncbi:Ig-like domain-containing protein [Cnuibacter sp. UC19_7]|uniref:Ig-like domain-containing protein n=1 Tax=Cnuibacter sp. UC19_7 TaxID=3350166 RepID=UPI003671D524
MSGTIGSGRIAGWIAAHRSTTATLVSGGTIAALVAVVSVVSTGFVAQQVDLHDGTVWVTSDTHHAAGRANPLVGELNGLVPLGAGSLDVDQSGSTVVVADRGDGEGRLVDTAAMTADQSFPLPAGEASILLSGDRAIVWSPESGSAWSTTVAALPAFDPDATADVTVGPNGAMAAWQGRLSAVSPATGYVYSTSGGEEQTSTSIDLAADADVVMTATDAGWVVFDRSTDRLISPAGTVQVEIDDPASAVLQQAGEGRQGVLLATRTALVRVDPASGATTTLSQGHEGTPAAPLETGGCTYAAWSDGTGWTDCGASQAAAQGSPAAQGSVAAPRDTAFEGMSSESRLAFRTNGDGGVLLNDRTSGRAWDVTRDNAVIDDWDDLLDTTTNDPQQDDRVTDAPETPDPVQQPPVAVDDDLGARAGRAQVLPVLLNDYDVNGDVLVIDDVTVPDGVDWRVDIIDDGQQLQLTLPSTSTGTLAFGYGISDGRGGTARATATVTVRAPGENSPPVQVRRTTLDVALGARATTDIRGDWYDPDGDPFYLASAGTPPPDSVTFRPEGQVTYLDSGTSTGARDISLVVSDGLATTAGTIPVVVHDPADVALVAEGFVVPLHVGVEETIEPLTHIRGGSDALRLTSVGVRDGVAVDADYVKGSVRLTASSAGTFLLDYSVADGARTATGTIRLQVTALPDANSAPVTVPHASYVRQGSSVEVDVLAGDYDPAGAVLIVTSAGPAPDPAVQVEVLEQRIIRVTLTGPLTAGSVSFPYTVSNGLASTIGSVTVVEVTPPAIRQPPVAVADIASVRVGDVVDIPVLDNDSQPDGDQLTLHPDLARPLSAGSGLLFVSGSVLRYLAPSTPGEYTAEYRVDAPDGQWATAQVTIRVRESDAASNSAPVPARITARVLAGETVRIPIPLTGIDPDGDSVQFAGVDSTPQKGTIVATGASWIDYTAGDYSAGTDSFGYTVVDGLGARASGTIRVGISPRADGARSPVATPDAVAVRPGRTVLVPVLTNDSDPDGSPLSLVRVSAQDGAATASVSGDLVVISAPTTPGRYGFVYDIENQRGGTSSTFVTADVTPDAPLARPVVSDTVLTLDDIAGRDTVDVDVLANVFFAEGPATQLGLSVGDGYGSAASVTSDHRLRVDVREQRQIIPFTVAHPDDPSITASGFVWVPGTRDALPQLRSGAPALVVQSGAELRIPLAEQVVVAGGGSPRITDPNTVRATHADGSSLVSGDATLVYRSAADYFGPASISFEVADGTGPDARRATLVLPITVRPATNQPPVFDGAVIEFEPGQQKTIDLTKLTTYPYPGAGNLLSYRVLGDAPPGFGYSLSGTTLTMTADPSARRGAAGSLSIGVADKQSEGRSGRIDVSVVASTRPLAVLGADSVIAPRGGTTTVDVLANDRAGNPFPDVPLQVVAVRGTDSAALPPGVSVATSPDRASLSVAVAGDAAPGDLTLQYQVADATQDPSRFVWSTVRVSIQDRPAPVTGLVVTGFADREVDVSFAPGAANNSPISGFVATATTSSGASVSTTCATTRCAVRTPGNGSASAVRISVSAQNGIGLSDPTTLGPLVWSDVLPGPPSALVLTPGDGSIAASWNPAVVPGGGSPVSAYEVRVDGRLAQTLAACASACSTTLGGVPNGVSTTVTVTAKNDAYPALAVWSGSEVSATTTPFGPPIAASVSAGAETGAAGRDVVVGWSGFGDNGNPVTGYVVQLLRGGTGVPQGAQACSVSNGRVSLPTVGGDVLAQQQSGAPGSVRFASLDSSSADYSVVVWGWNAAGCTPSAVQTVSVYPRPGVPSASTTMVQDGSTRDAYVTVSGDGSRFRIQRVDASGAPVGDPADFSGAGFPRTLIGGAFGEVLRFRLQACSVWSTVQLCGDWSGPFAAPEPSLTFDLDPDPQLIGDTFSWVNPPANGSLAATFLCGRSGSTATAAAAGTTCTAPPGVGAPWLEVTVAGHSYTVSGSKG